MRAIRRDMLPSSRLGQSEVPYSIRLCVYVPGRGGVVVGGRAHFRQVLACVEAGK